MITTRNNQTQKIECRLSELFFPYFAMLSSVFALASLGPIIKIMQTSRNAYKETFLLLANKENDKAD